MTVVEKPWPVPQQPVPHVHGGQRRRRWRARAVRQGLRQLPAPVPGSSGAQVAGPVRGHWQVDGRQGRGPLRPSLCATCP